MTLLKELIDIPPEIQKGDFVLKLAEGVTKPEETLADYVVTPELRKCFDDALSFIRSSVEGRTSKASYLHGSFGAGKSHFMAVLHLILHGNPHARGIQELAPVIQKHNSWIEGKKFLLVPYHMIGANDVESGVLGGYVDFIRRTHPKATIPGVYLAEGLFKDAEGLRAAMGDAAFFAKLNEGASGDAGWGDLDAKWDATRFEAAVKASPGDEERSQLISALVEKYFGSYDTQAGGRGEAFLSLDKGLSVISRHAQGLGYDAVILFLDELILWLAGHAADLQFIQREVQKLAKLVEAQSPDRPVPLVSFIARQRDLRELIGDTVPGAQQYNFGEILGHWEGRFHKITLEDRNLPAIAEKRVLKPLTPTAKQELDASFEQATRVRDAVMNVLLTTEGDRAMFRKVYPFSPALVQTLIAVSSILQRERTALKVMKQLLVDQRETLKLGDIVPVGDLFDVIAHGDEAFSPEMAVHFDNAKRLYHQKLLPLIEKHVGVRAEDIAKLPYDDPKRVGFRGQDRLIKTLLLSALVPDVESLRGLNAERLAALNHGTIRSPIPGRESQQVLGLVRGWAAACGEVRVGDEATNPSISVQLSGVDTESILAQASREDNPGNRIRRVRQMLFDRLGIEGEGEFEQRYEYLWRNTKRQCNVLFRNIRELGDNSFENAADDDWTIIIDFPFDEAGHGPKDDLSRVQKYRDAHPEGAKTLCWVPAFFSADAQRDLGTLVVLEHVLTGERFGSYSNHLSPQDRQAAKAALESQRNVLRQRVSNHLDAAYGLDPLSPGSLDTVHDLEPGEHFVSLLTGFDVRPPATAHLKQTLEGLLDQAFAHEFPGAPQFETEVKTIHLKKVAEIVEDAAQSVDGRTAVDKTMRSLVRQIAVPMMLGEMPADGTHFLIGQHWLNHLNRRISDSGGEVTVKELRRWIDSPKPMGLPKEAANLIILTYATQTNRTFYEHGAAVEPTVQSLPDVLELRQQRLPDAATWVEAVRRAGELFGVAVSSLVSPSNVNALAERVHAKSSEVRKPCQSYARELREKLKRFGIAAEDSKRLATAEATAGLLDKLANVEGEQVVATLATVDITEGETAIGECIGQAEGLRATLAATQWGLIDVLRNLNRRDAEAASALEGLRGALVSDEHAVALGPALSGAQATALRLVQKNVTPPDVTDSEPPRSVTPKDVTDDGVRKPTIKTKERLSLIAAKELLKEIEDECGSVPSLRIDITWTVEGDQTR